VNVNVGVLKAEHSLQVVSIVDTGWQSAVACKWMRFSGHEEGCLVWRKLMLLNRYF
jgi:hypothetical protein